MKITSALKGFSLAVAFSVATIGIAGCGAMSDDRKSICGGFDRGDCVVECVGTGCANNPADYYGVDRGTTAGVARCTAAINMARAAMQHNCTGEARCGEITRSEYVYGCPQPALQAGTTAQQVERTAQ